MPSESDIISRLRRLAGATPDVRVGIGDDAAVLKRAGGTDLVACCDLMVEGVHFRTEWTPPRLLGRKALATNLSDVAAMGAVPRFAMLSIALPRACPSGFVDDLFDGLFELAKESGVAIIGGDTSSSTDSLFIDVSVIGECESGKAVTRGGAKIGDSIYVSGSLGASALGLSLLESGIRLEELREQDVRRSAILKHLSPLPQLKLGQSLGTAGLATAMIDISDGLSTDLSHILDASHCGAVIHASSIPIAECVCSIASEKRGVDSLRLALNGGEEYELLFTSAVENHQRIADVSGMLGVPVTAIGEIVAGKGLKLDNDGVLETLEPLGYQHLI